MCNCYTKINNGVLKMELTIKKMKLIGMENWGYFVSYEGNVCTEKFMASFFRKKLHEYKNLMEVQFHAQTVKGWMSRYFYHYFETEQEAESFIVMTKLLECV